MKSKVNAVSWLIVAWSSMGPESLWAAQAAATGDTTVQADSAGKPAPSLPVLQSLVREVLRSSPAIQAARKDWEASTKRPSQVSSLPNPELTFGSMSSGNPLPYSTIGTGPIDWASFMFMQKVPWPGKLSLKGDIAETEANQKGQQYRAVTLKVVRQLKEAYFQYHYLNRASAILERYRDLLEKFSKIAAARYSVGTGIQADVLRSQVEVSLIIERLEVLGERRQRVQARINSLLNRSPESPLPQTDPIVEPRVELPLSLERLYLIAREQNPEVGTERLEIQRASLKLDLARKDLRPDFNLSTAYSLRGGEFANMYEYRVGLELPIYFWRKERLQVEESRTGIERSRHSYQDTLQDVTFRIKDSYIGARTSRRLIDLYRKGIIPQTTASLDSALSAYEVGTIDFLTLVQNALTLLNYELQYEEQIRDYFEDLVRLEELLNMVFVQ